MPSTVKRPIPVFMLTAPMDVVVEVHSERTKGQLTARQPTGGVVAVELRPELGSLMLLHFYRGSGETPAMTLEGLLIGSAADSMDSASARGYVVRWNWAHSPEGEKALRHYLTEYLAYPPDRLADQSVLSVDRSAIFAFRAQRRDRLEWVARRLQRRSLPSAEGTVPAELAAQKASVPPLTRLRAHERVRVDVPCRFTVDAQKVDGAKGRIYNLGREGVFVATPDRVPDEGDAVRVRIMMRHKGKKRRVQLVGTVRWPMQRSDTQAGGGFGVEVRTVSDGAKGRLFHAFLDFLIDRHVSGHPPAVGDGEATGPVEATETVPIYTSA